MMDEKEKMAGETVERILENVIGDITKEYKAFNRENASEFERARHLGHYEILDALRDWLEIYGIDTAPFGLGENLEQYL